MKRSDKPSLFALYPELVQEWDYERNAPLSPEAITYGSNKKVFWKCCNGHSWQAPVSNRTGVNKTGCPYCSGKKPIVGYNDLVTLYPDLAKEWDYERNNGIKPEDYTIHSEKKVWWIGACGHNWVAAICNRTLGHGCIYCSGREVLSGFNDLSTICPDLAKEWNYEKNKNLTSKRGRDISTPDKVMKSANYKVWWKCKYGHEWEATINHRYSHRNCPQCGGSQTSMPEQAIAFYLEQCCDISNRIKIRNMEIDVFIPKYNIGIEYDGAYYHTDPQRDLKKDTVIKEAGITLIRVKESTKNECISNTILYKEDGLRSNFAWACNTLFDRLSELTEDLSFAEIDIDLSRDYSAIRNRIDLEIKNNSLLTMMPELSEEWNCEKNGVLMPDMFEASSNHRVWWICKKGHEWQASINSRTGVNRTGCPYCSNKKVLPGYNDLATVNPDLAKEWNCEKNVKLTPDSVLPKSGKMVWWKCNEGHEWKASISSRAYGINCPYCSGRYVVKGKNDLQSLFPNIAKEWNSERNTTLTPLDVTAYSHKKVWWKCSKGHEWESSISNRTGISKNGCPYCSGRIAKKVVCIETGVVYSSAAEAKRATGACKVAECCSGKRNISGGYHWKYYDEKE